VWRHAGKRREKSVEGGRWRRRERGRRLGLGFPGHTEKDKKGRQRGVEGMVVRWRTTAHVSCVERRRQRKEKRETEGVWAGGRWAWAREEVSCGGREGEMGQRKREGPRRFRVRGFAFKIYFLFLSCSKQI
jgi:hypothetical protein